MKQPAALSLMLTPKGPIFITDTQVHEHPTADELVAITLRAARAVELFGITPKIALLSASNFGTRMDLPSSTNMREALAKIRASHPELEIEGEMKADYALIPQLRDEVFPGNRLSGIANLLIMPDVEAGNISLNVLKAATDATMIGPMLLGVDAPVHVLTNNSTTRRILNMAAIAVVEAQMVKSGIKSL